MKQTMLRENPTTLTPIERHTSICTPRLSIERTSTQLVESSKKSSSPSTESEMWDVPWIYKKPMITKPKKLKSQTLAHQLIVLQQMKAASNPKPQHPTFNSNEKTLSTQQKNSSFNQL